MSDSDLSTIEDAMLKQMQDQMRDFANSSRSRTGIGATHIGFSGEGVWQAGKNKIQFNKRQLGANVFDMMHGHRSFRGRVPLYVAGKVFGPQPFVPLPPGEMDQLDEKGDPIWDFVRMLPLFEPKGPHEIYAYSTATGGGGDAIATLVNAFADHVAGGGRQLPVVELNGDSYTNSRGKRIHVPRLDIVGWIDRPATLKALDPPPLARVEPKLIQSSFDAQALPAPAAPAPSDARTLEDLEREGFSDFDDSI